MTERMDVGITIGPILDALSEAATPAELWLASTTFSDLARRLCDRIVNAFCPDNRNQMISPAHTADANLRCGVGLYHDRILFMTEMLNEDTLKTIITEEKRATAERLFGENAKEEQKVFFEQYLQIHYIARKTSLRKNNESIVQALAKQLDALELCTTFPEKNDEHPLRKLFTGMEDELGSPVEKTRVYHDLGGDIQLKQRGRLVSHKKLAHGNSNSDTRTKSMYHELGGVKKLRQRGRLVSRKKLAQGNSNSDTRKVYKYYAVVQADADGTGNFLKELNDEKTRVFSEQLLSYGKKAAKKVREAGGVTVYAGGDDLLFMAPVLYGENTVFDLCETIQKIFHQCMDKAACRAGFVGALPTQSFGISICYHGMPLCEAFEIAREQLFDQAKKSFPEKGEKPTKGCMAVSLRKHSGQTTKLLIPCKVVGSDKTTECTKVLAMMKKIIRQENEREKNDPTGNRNLSSVLQTVVQRKALLEEMLKTAEEHDNTLFIDHWKNLFDNPTQSQFMTFIEELGEDIIQLFGKEPQNGRSICAQSVSDEELKQEETKRAHAIYRLLYVIKFFVEEKGEGED